MNKSEKLFDIINQILISNNENSNSNISLSDHLKDDLGLQSIHIVELVVELEDEFGVDIFEAGNVETVSDVLERIKSN